LKRLFRSLDAEKAGGRKKQSSALSKRE